MAVRNLFHASGPSIISGWGFIDSMMAYNRREMTVLPIDLPPSSQAIRITGKVFPACIDFSFTTTLVPSLQIDSSTPSILSGLDAKFHFKVEHSRVEILCYVNRIQATDFDPLFTSAYELTRSAVDIMAFSTGNGFTLILEKAHYPDGTVADIYHSDPTLPPLCTSYRTNQAEPDGSLDTALLTIMRDRSIMMALHDLTETMEAPSRIRTNCFRAVEAITQSISRSGKPPKIYGVLRDALNISDAYIDPIREESKGPRHGDPFRPPSMSEYEIRQRAWTIMNRFLEFRKRKNQPLTSPDFVVL